MECAQGTKGSRAALGAPANAPAASSLVCSQDGELAAWHNLPVVGTAQTPPSSAALTLQSLISAT